MLHEEEKTKFSKESIDYYLKEVAKEYRRRERNGIPAEIILIGGSSVVLNYGFRDSTLDVDGYFRASSALKDAINKIGDEYNLPTGWLNDDFKRTTSFSPKIVEHSKYYKSFYNILSIRTISEEYLIAMKLKSGRQYKHDLSDVIGVLAAHEKQGTPITKEKIEKAATELYGSWGALPEESRRFAEMERGSGTDRVER